MFFLKILDDQDAQLELMDPAYTSPLPVEMRWGAWAANPEGITGDELLAFINNRLTLAMTDPNNIVAFDDVRRMLKGVMIEPAAVTDDDFKAAAIEGSKTIDILDFVKEEEIDLRYFETPYYLVPGKGAEKSYALLREAIRSTKSVGIGKIIIRQHQHLAGIKVVGDALVLEVMRFANELVNSNEYNFPARSNVRPQELKMAEQLVENLAQPFDPSRYTDDYRANLMKLIKAKMKGKKIKLEEPAEETEDSGVLDLMSRPRGRPRQGRPKKKPHAKKTAAKASRTSKRKSA